MSNIEQFTFGIEIETTIPAAARIRVGSYHFGQPVDTAFAAGAVFTAPVFEGKHWKAEADGSIQIDKPGHVRCEFVSPVLRGEAGVLHLIEFVDFLRKIGASVNRSCGMHIHIGVAGAAGGEETTAYVDRLARLVGFNSRALYAQTGTILRERGQYCRPLGETVRKAVNKAKKSGMVSDAAGGLSRYHLLNLTTLTTRGTVEFRCFAGTLNTSKILLHLFSVLVLCIVARKAKTPAAWDNRPLSGTKAVTNLLKVRPVTKIVGAAVFERNFRRMIEKALEMAGKYDLQVAAVDLATMTAAIR